MEEIILATTNKGKLEEFNKMAEGMNIKFITIDMPDIVEDGKTYEENSYIKANAIAKITNKRVLADDSGLEVEAIPFELGVHTARYRNDLKTYKERCKALIEAVDSKNTNRNAKFVCVLTLVDSTGNFINFRGESKGEISKEIKGENGHGYDPVFYSYDLKKCFGEATIEEKESVSHRGRAFEKFKEYLGGK